jgi:DMSO/TMAO reductase YedYZ heme-binding membrane subunit
VTIQQSDLLFWMLARTMGLASFLALGVAILSGVALRTSVLDRLGTNRAWLELHQFCTVLWIPLGGLHLISLLADKTARIRPVDLIVPFGVDYGVLPVGLGSIALDLFILVAVTGWMKRDMSQRLWSLIHRLSYPAFAVAFAHAVLSGTDFSAPAVSALAWSFAFAVLILAAARVAWGRLPA